MPHYDLNTFDTVVKKFRVTLAYNVNIIYRTKVKTCTRKLGYVVIFLGLE